MRTGKSSFSRRSQLAPHLPFLSNRVLNSVPFRIAAEVHRPLYTTYMYVYVTVYDKERHAE